MSKESLFKHIRYEDVILWSGAGFSKYAGYPLGDQLKKIIYDELSKEEQKNINFNSSLADLTDEFVRLKNGTTNELFQIIRKVFSKPPISLEYHTLLTKIPHLKTIITTNYDNLFEIAYGSNGHKIIRDIDLSYWDKTKVNILKVHGDLTDPSSIVLTKSDYAKFDNHHNKSSPFWSLIIEKITTEVVLFLGYGYEDPNIWALFEHVAKYISNHKKESFFVAPNLPSQKVYFLERNGINYLNYTAEEFLPDLLENIKANILIDFEKQKVSPETVKKFLNNYNIQPTLQGTETGFVINAINSVSDDPLDGNIKLTLDTTPSFIEKFNDFFLTATSKELEITEEVLKDVKWDIAGIAMHNPDDEISKILIKRLPSKILDFDLVFFNENFELNQLKAEVFRSTSGSIIRLKIYGLNINIEVTSKNNVVNTKISGSHLDLDIAFEYEHDLKYSTVKEELEIYTFLKYLFSSAIFTIVSNGHSVFQHHIPIPDNAKIKQAEQHIQYFTNLKCIEKTFQIKFQNFTGITSETMKKVFKIMKVINNEPLEIKTDEIELKMVELHSNAMELFEQLNNGTHSMSIDYDVSEEITLYGHILKLKCTQIAIPSASIKNIEELKSGKTERIIVVSRTGTLLKSYKIDSLN